MHAGFWKRVLGALGLVALLSGCGGAGSSSATTTSPATPTPLVHGMALFAGNVSGPGTVDGTGVAASFHSPQAIAADAQGNVYVAEFYGQTIRKITPEGVVSTWAGVTGEIGSSDGAGAAARFNQPMGLATDSSGNVYVADAGNRAIRKITPEGVVSTWAGSADPTSVHYADGYRLDARFASPRGLSFDGSGNLFVADTDNHVIRKIGADGMVSTLAGTAGAPGFADGNGAAARFRLPNGVVADGSGNVYVTDNYNFEVRKITATGDVSTLAGAVGRTGSTDGTGSAARFFNLAGICMDASGNVLVSDTYGQTIRKITPQGEVSTWAGAARTGGSADGVGSAARFESPWGLALDASGNVLVADFGNHTIRRITSLGLVSTVAGSAAQVGQDDGTGAAARFYAPDGLAADSLGNVYVADTFNHTVRKVSPAGVVSTLAGTAGMDGSADGLGVQARFFYPSAVAVDAHDNVFVSDTSNHTVRKITPLGEVSTFAGTAGASGTDDGRGVAARFQSPKGLAFDSSGNLYVADSGNNTIRKITPEGEVSTFAGSAGVPGRDDGMGAAASFYRPYGVAVDGAGNVYVVDASDTTVRKISPQGEVSTWVGTAAVAGTADGSGAAARFYLPTGLATDRHGNVYVSDTENNLVRKVTPEGVVSTLAGVAGTFGEKLGALPGALNRPQGICVFGDLLYVSMQNGIVRIQ